jgi:formate--tetrahydrofolate ligase
MAKSDIEIAREATLKPISEIAQKLDISPESFKPFGHDKAKLTSEFINSLNGNKDGKLILVTAISPTPAGEGKTTTTVGLGDGLNSIGKKAVMCLREPSLGPCFGMKGGAAGGGYAQVVPMEDINLHFTGDFHAIGAAHNLLSALIDNHIHWENKSGLDPRRVTWKRVMDMNDRALRDIVVALGGPANGIPRESGFDITVASEIMAIFCLATDLDDLSRRIGNIVIGYTRDLKPVHARDVNAPGAMTVLLRDAFMPNLVQTLENNPAFIHGGPFANIAHGCNSVIATKTALKLADFDIKCRKAGLSPDAVVLVATARALKMHGGVAKDQLTSENVDAIKKGCENLGRHIRNLKQFGVPVTVAMNRFSADTDDELNAVREFCAEFGVKAFDCNHWGEGSKGTQELAQHVADVADSGQAQFHTLYDDDMGLLEKTKHVARTLYGAEGIVADKKVRDQFAKFEADGYGHFPVCMAKTQYSFSTDPALMGAPTGHDLPIREIRLSAGAEFIVVVCGDIMTMPGLPRLPSADSIRLNDAGQVEGLF